MGKVEELEQFEIWTKDILLGIGADEDTISLAHVGLMVRMIYDKGSMKGAAEGAEQLKAEIRKRSEHYHGDPCVEGGSYYVVLGAVLAPTKEEEKPSEEVLQKQMEEQVMEDQQKEDMLAEDMRRHQQQDDRERWAKENL